MIYVWYVWYVWHMIYVWLESPKPTTKNNKFNIVKTHYISLSIQLLLQYCSRHPDSSRNRWASSEMCFLPGSKNFYLVLWNPDGTPLKIFHDTFLRKKKAIQIEHPSWWDKISLKWQIFFVHPRSSCHCINSLACAQETSWVYAWK